MHYFKKLFSIICFISLFMLSTINIYAKPSEDYIPPNYIDDYHLYEYEQEHVRQHLAVKKMSEVWNIEDGTLTDNANLNLLEDAKSLLEKINNEKIKSDLELIYTTAKSEIEKRDFKETYTYYGNCRITFYCNCSQCCAQWAGGPTASGTIPTQGRTVANGSLSFGTKVLINGEEYIVEDRGVSGNQFDIYLNSHSECYDRGLFYTDVYIVA